MIPKMSLYKIINLFGDDSRYPTISHKKCFVPNVNVLDFVGDFFGGIVYALSVYICICILCMCIWDILVVSNSTYSFEGSERWSSLGRLERPGGAARYLYVYLRKHGIRTVLHMSAIKTWERNGVRQIWYVLMSKKNCNRLELVWIPSNTHD